MVYCGKPSRGCQMCRTRRIKCDETKPTCNQCTKSRRVCPGYKDDFDLVFRNETQATERRARRAVNSKKHSAQISFVSQQMTFAIIPTKDQEEDQGEPLAASGSVVDVSMALAPASPPFIPVDEQAPCFFVSNYVLTPRHSTRGYFDFVMPMLKTEGPESQLSLAFSAVSLAALANQPNVRGGSLMNKAFTQYAKALKAVNLALQNTIHQKTDQTLAAILMLGFFENIASERSNAMAWFTHIDGAVALVKMRGKKQLRTKVGYSLFACVRTQMIVSSLTGAKAPQLGSDWWVNDTAKNDADVFITRLNMRVAELRYEINNALASFPRTPEYFQQILNLMKRAQAMEQEYLTWQSRLPPEWLPRTVAWVDQVPGGDLTKAEVCPGKVDMFADIYIASTWNQARIARLFISGAIVRCAAWICSPVDYRTTPEYATAVRLCGDLITDVIAAIPYHLGWRINSEGVLKSGDFTGYSSSNVNYTAPKAIGAFFSMWPLFSIANTDYISDAQRLWSKGRLLYISEEIGLNHAKVLSNFQFRLPSMIIRRDAMVHQASLALAAGTGVGYPYSHSIPNPAHTLTPSAPLNPTHPHQQPSTTAPPSNTNPTKSETGTGIEHEERERENVHYHNQSQYQNQSPAPPTENGEGEREREREKATATSTSTYALNPIQNREVMLRETWDIERKNLLKKASNSQGDSMERLAANFLAV